MFTCKVALDGRKRTRSHRFSRQMVQTARDERITEAGAQAAETAPLNLNCIPPPCLVTLAGCAGMSRFARSSYRLLTAHTSVLIGSDKLFVLSALSLISQWYHSNLELSALQRHPPDLRAVHRIRRYSRL